MTIINMIMCDLLDRERNAYSNHIASTRIIMTGAIMDGTLQHNVQDASDED
jgi:hypothetical protein